jgi:hypothetical protein
MLVVTLSYLLGATEHVWLTKWISLRMKFSVGLLTIAAPAEAGPVATSTVL